MTRTDRTPAGMRQREDQEQPPSEGSWTQAEEAVAPSIGTTSSRRHANRLPMPLPANATAQQERATASDASGDCCCGSRDPLACGRGAEGCGSASANASATLAYCPFRSSGYSFHHLRPLCSSLRTRNVKVAPAEESQAAQRCPASRRAVEPRGFACADRRAKCVSEEFRDPETAADITCRSFASNSQAYYTKAII